MGFTSVRIGISPPGEKQPRSEVELLADTGALYSILPASVLSQLGIEPEEMMDFELADGSSMQRFVGEARFFFDGRKGTSKVIFGDATDARILGVTAMEEMGLEVDPTRRELRPARPKMYLAGPGSKKAGSQFEVECPCCKARLLIDSEVEAVLSFEAAKRAAPDVDLSDTARHLREQEEQREAKFAKSVEHEKKKEDLFERLFQENLKKAKEQPIEKPLRDFDLE